MTRRERIISKGYIEMILNVLKEIEKGTRETINIKGE